jgi:hypothetical protein
MASYAARADATHSREILNSVKALVVALTLLCMGGGAWAQTLPSARIGSAPLVSVANSDTALGSATTRTASLAPFGHLGARPIEIVELADALNNDPDLIFEFVRNNIRTEFRYGSAKGALGALIDRSGTAFDQAQLLVELFREAGLTAQYVLGSVTLNQSQFSAWTGITRAQGACTLLAHGGIPATVNGVTDASCAFAGNVDVSSVTMGHIWVTAVIGGTTYVFDPANKTTGRPVPLNLASVAGLSVGEIADLSDNGASSGTQSGGPWIRNVNVTGMENELRTAVANVVTHIRAQSTAPEFADLAGLPEIVREEVPQGGWRFTSHPLDEQIIRTWSDIPNQYRTRVIFNITLTPPGVSPLNQTRTVYTDEFYGRRTQLRTNFDGEHMTSLASYFQFAAWLEIDDVSIASFSANCPAPGCPQGLQANVSMAIDHPYAASALAYMDRTFQRTFPFATSVALVIGVGQSSPALAAKWSGERIADRRTNMPLAQICTVSVDECIAHAERMAAVGNIPTGDHERQTLASAWLSQYGTATDIAAHMAGGRVEQHDVLGLVYAYEPVDLLLSPEQPPAACQQPPATTCHDFALGSRTTQLDIEPAYSVIAADGDAARRRSIVYTTAALAAALEGSLLEQQQGVVDATSSVARLSWAARAEDEDPHGGGTRRVYDFTAVSNANRPALLRVDGASTSPDSLIGSGSPWKGALDALIQSYVVGGFRVTASEEALLGPGSRYGRRTWPAPCTDYSSPNCTFQQEVTLQRGGAIIATRLVNGEPVEIAHILSGVGGIAPRLKGGAGEPATEQGAFDPSHAADLLRDRFVDRSSALGVDIRTGAVSYTTPTLDSIGAEEPYGLSVAFSYAPGIGARRNWDPDYGVSASPLSAGEAGANNWTNNWEFHFDVGTSGPNAMGEHSAEAGAVSLVALWALSDTFASSLPDYQRDLAAAIVADWWRRQFRNNTATYARGAASMQFVRTPSGEWVAPPGNFARLTQTGERTRLRPTCGGQDSVTLTNWVWPAETRRWSDAGVDFTLTLRGGV